MSGMILALDLATRTGFAFGEVGTRSPPTTGAVRLKDPSDDRAIAFSNLIAWLDQQFRTVQPALVVKEAMLPLQAFRNIGNAAATVEFAMGLHAIVEGVCIRFGVRFESPADSSVRKHFIGFANKGARRDTKDAVIARAITLGYLPRDSRDDDRADAAALWDFACAHYGRRSGGLLHLFGENAA